MKYFSRIGHFEYILLSGITGEMKILIPLAGQLSGGSVKPETIMGEANGILLAESGGMLYDG